MEILGFPSQGFFLGFGCLINLEGIWLKSQEVKQLWSWPRG